MQSLASKCIRGIVIGRDGEGDHDKISYFMLRMDYKIDTVSSKKQRDNQCDIYRWGTSLPPSYLSSINECELHVSRGGGARERMEELDILIKMKKYRMVCRRNTHRL